MWYLARMGVIIMCNGIAILVWEKDNQIKGLCTGISSHDELAKLDEDLRYGKIEPYRFELLYPCNLTFDRSTLPSAMGIAKEQPPFHIWEKALSYLHIYAMKHTKQQLQKANLRYANLSNADLSNADLSNADLSNADLRYANLSNADLSNADLSNADLSNADLRYANLRDANLRYANLSGANLSGANISGADLRDANLSEFQKSICIGLVL